MQNIQIRYYQDLNYKNPIIKGEIHIKYVKYIFPFLLYTLSNYRTS